MTDEKIWIGQNGKRHGPYQEADVRQWLKEGKLTHDALGWHEGMADWVSLVSLFPAVANEPSPPPIPPPVAPTPAPAAPISLVAPAAAVPVSTAHEPSSAYEPPSAYEPHSAYEPPSAYEASSSYEPPSAEPPSTYANDGASAAAADRADLPAPPSLHWGLVLLFTMLTFGIFSIIWPFIQAKWVRKIDPQSNVTLLLGIAVGCGVVGYISYFAGFAAMLRGETGSSLIGFGGLLLFGAWVLFLVAYFSMAGSLRRTLPDYGIPVAIGGITLFFFTMYYMQGQLSWVARWKETGQVSPKASKGIFWVIFFVIPFVLGIVAGIGVSSYKDYATRARAMGSTIPAASAEVALVKYDTSANPCSDAAPVKAFASSAPVRS
ncbi:MAG: GYF domain-containing protein [Rhodanobacter sp.]